jgi:guanylate kinase
VQRRGVCLVLSAPSGAGKSTIAQKLVESEEDLSVSVSVTTRAPRPGEREGVHYYFRDQAAFDGLVRDGALIEWAQVFGQSYGTPRAPVEAALARGRDLVFDIDWQGHRKLRAALPGDVVSVFILPPSLAELEARLRRRESDDADNVSQRMQTARAEISHWPEFDHVVVNDDFEAALAAVRAVLHAARIAASRQVGLRGMFG